MPPNICFTTTMATTLPNTAINGLMVTGRFSASKIPVTTQERSLTVWGRFIMRRDRYSLKMQEATQVRITAMARRPKITTEAIMAGVRARITSSMIFWVVRFP